MRELLKFFGVLIWLGGAFLLFIMVCVEWIVARYFWAVVASVALILYIVSLWRPKEMKLWKRVLIMLAMSMVIFGNLFIFGSGGERDDAETCSDDGICSEKVITDEECVERDGVWLIVGEQRLCYLEWATARPAVIKALKKECEQAGKVWDDDVLRCLGE